MNTSQSNVIYLLNSLTATHRKSQKFNSNLRVKINHMEFEDKFLTKTGENVNSFLPEDC